MYTEKDLINFGNYLLSKERKENVRPQDQDEGWHSDLENWNEKTNTISQWIKVQDSLPDKNQLVLVVIGNSGMRIGDPQLAFRRETNCGGWCWHFKGESIGKVYFWQPLPKMPTD